KLFGVLTALIVGVAVVTLALRLPPHPHRPRPVTSIPRATFSRIETGMTLAEVTLILGPPGNYSTMETEPTPFDPGEVIGTAGIKISQNLWWGSDSGSVFVSFDNSGRVMTGAFCPTRPSIESSSSRFFKRVLYLKYLWQQWFS